MTSSSLAAAQPALPGRVAAAISWSVIPALILSQWLTLGAGVPARSVFNASYLAAMALLVVLSVRRLGRAQVAMLVAAPAVVLISAVVNRVPVAVVTSGAPAYLAPALVVAATLSTAPSDAERSAARLSVWVLAAMGLAAVAQALLGRPAYRWLGQELDYPRWWERGRATGLVVNPARLAHLELTGIAFLPTVARRRSVALALLALGAAASGGRLVLVGSVAVGVLVLAVRWRGYRIVSLAAGAAVVGFVVLQFLLPLARADLADRLAAAGDDLRLVGLEAGAQAITDHPWFGLGPGRFGSTTAFATESPYHALYGLPDTRSPEYAEWLAQHGDVREIDVGTAQIDLGFVQTAAEIGLLGALGAVAFPVVVLAGEVIRRRSMIGLAVLMLLGVFSAFGPGITDISLAVVMLWWSNRLSVPSP